MNRLYQITVTNPCQVGWDQMAPNEQGRYCSACSKTVIDFTNYSDQEIADYFIALNGQAVCGHFKKQQVDRIRIEIPETLLTTRLARWKKFLVVCMLVFGTSLFPFETVLSQTLIVSTTSEPVKNQHKKKAVKYSKKKKIKTISIPTEWITIAGYTTTEPINASPIAMICSWDKSNFLMTKDQGNSFIEETNLPEKDKTPNTPSKKESQFYILPEKIRTRRSRKKKP